MILTPFGDTFLSFCVILHSLKLDKSNFTSIECLKYIITCLYQLVFMFLPIFRIQIDIVAELLAILWFWPLSGTLFLSFCVFLHTLRLDKSNLTSIECLKCIIKCLYQLVFKFCQFLDSKLTYLLKYCRFCDFEPFQGTFTLAHYEKGKIHIYQLKLQN